MAVSISVLRKYIKKCLFIFVFGGFFFCMLTVDLFDFIFIF